MYMICSLNQTGSYSYSLTDASSSVDVDGCLWSSQQEPGAPYLLGGQIVEKPEAW